MFTKMSSRPKMEVPLYEDNLNVDELMDWIHALDKYFDYEDVDKDKQVKYVVSRLKGHATLWWDEVQVERRRKEKPKLKIGTGWWRKLKVIFYLEIIILIFVSNCGILNKGT